MAQRIIALLFILFAASFSNVASASLFGSSSPGQFVKVDQAFAFDFSQQGNTLNLSWQVKPGYYLYRQQISITADNATLGEWSMPPGKAHEDEFYGKTEIYPQSLSTGAADPPGEGGRDCECDLSGLR